MYLSSPRKKGEAGVSLVRPGPGLGCSVHSEDGGMRGIIVAAAAAAAAAAVAVALVALARGVPEQRLDGGGVEGGEIGLLLHRLRQLLGHGVGVRVGARAGVRAWVRVGVRVGVQLLRGPHLLGHRVGMRRPPRHLVL